MKGVIVGIEGKSAAALLADGCIIKTANKNYVIGQVITMEKQVGLNFKKRMAWFGSAAALLVFSAVSGWAYLSPYSYVSLDVNPSIEYSLNRFDRVLSVKAVNDDGEEILKQISLANLSNKKIDEAIALTVKQISEEGYFAGDIEGGIMIATSGKDLKKAEQLALRLEQAAEEETQAEGDTVEVESVSVGLERVQQAKELGVTPGKLNLVEKLKESAPNPEDIDINKWLTTPVKQIMKATKDFKNAQKGGITEEAPSAEDYTNPDASTAQENSTDSKALSTTDSPKAKTDNGLKKETSPNNPAGDSESTEVPQSPAKKEQTSPAGESPNVNNNGKDVKETSAQQNSQGKPDKEESTNGNAKDSESPANGKNKK